MAQRDARLIGGIYRIGQVIADGGMLATFTAYNHNTNDVVGLHVITLQTPEQISTAQHLLQILTKRQGLYSSHTIRVYDWGIEGNRIYIATDPPRGVSLQHVIDNDNIDLRRSIDLIRQLLEGIKALHKQGIAGLDLRPQLITVDTIGVKDRVQIDDIGLRTLLLSLGYISTLQSSDIGFLDPRYASPEYLYNGTLGTWSDIYQAGLLLFTLISGRLPFVGRTLAETGMLQSSGPIPNIQQYKYDAPSALQPLLEHALAKDPAARFPNADAFIHALNIIPIPTPTGGYAPIVIEKDPMIPQPSINLTTDMPPITHDHIDVTQHVAPAGPPTQPKSTGLTAGQIPIPNIPTDRGVYAYLCFEHSENDIQRFALTSKSVIVGRQDPKRGTMPNIDLSKLDSTMTVSRQHARIRFEETFFYIEDLKSRNKTRLGELFLTPLKAELLQHGDTIQFGSVRMRFEIPGMSKAPLHKKPEKNE